MPALSTTCPLSLVCLLTNELLNKYRVIMQMSLRVDLQFYVYLAARIVASLETTSGLSLNNSSTIFFTSSPVNGLTSRLVFLVSARNSGVGESVHERAAKNLKTILRSAGRSDIDPHNRRRVDGSGFQ